MRWLATGNWRNVVAVRVNLLARNTETTPGYSDSKLYTLGNNADGTANTCVPTGTGISTGPLLCDELNYRRHAFNAEVRMANPAGRGVTP